MQRLFLSLSVGLLLAGSVFAAKKEIAPMNPLLSDWAPKYGGVPNFDKIEVKDFKPALDEAMNVERAEIEKIVKNSKPANFENTILAFEHCGSLMDRVSAMYGVWSGGMSTPEFQKVDQELSPKFAAFQDEIIQNGPLFQRIETVYNSAEYKKLKPEQQRLTWSIYTRFVLQGARLSPEQKVRASEINQRLATLSTQFAQNMMADEEKDALIIEKASDLEGLPQPQIDSAAEEAEHRGLKGKWVIANTRSSMDPFLTYSPNRALREKAFKIWSSRGDKGDSHDNKKIVSEILKLRTERSKLLGYPTFAHWHLADSMAKEPQAAMDLMMKVWKPAVAQVHQEVADMQAIVDGEKGKFKIQPWDYRYYAEKVRKAKYDLDLNSVKPYLQLDSIRDAMFFAAGKLYGFKFVQIKDVPVFHKDMTVFKVVGRDGKQVGLWYFDPYARAGKNSGAWMSAYREQKKVNGKSITTIVSNNSNFVKGKPGEPVLLSWDDAITMFHEFGHALHGLNSNVTYGSLSGTNTARDFVEFPSQVNENYLSTPEVMKFLKNRKGEMIPQALVEKIEKAKFFNQGFMTVEFLASAIVDMKLHLVGEKDIDPAKFEKETLKEIGMPSEVIMRHRIPQFAHLFSNEGYAAGYYGYLWAQVLDHDAFEAFIEAGSPYDQKVAKRLRDHIMSVGNTVDPAETYRKFRGRDAKVDALLRARGFPVPTETSAH